MLLYILHNKGITCNKVLLWERADNLEKIVIIGAGIIGATAAYELSNLGKKVTMIDQQVEGRATSAAAGIICPWITKRRNKEWYELPRKGAVYLEQIISDLQANSGQETGYKKVGAMRLHTDKSELETVKDFAIQRRENAPQMGEISLLSKEETKAKFPLLNEDYYSLFIEGAARVDGRALRDSLIKVATSNGVSFIKGKADLVYARNKVNGAKVGENIFDADIVIASNGVWMPSLLAPLAITLNITAQKGEVIHLHVEGLDTDTLPVVMPPTNQYLLSFDQGKIVVGATRTNTKTLQTHATAGGVHHVLHQALGRAHV